MRQFIKWLRLGWNNSIRGPLQMIQYHGAFTFYSSWAIKMVLLNILCGQFQTQMKQTYEQLNSRIEIDEKTKDLTSFKFNLIGKWKTDLKSNARITSHCTTQTTFYSIDLFVMWHSSQFN